MNAGWKEVKIEPKKDKISFQYIETDHIAEPISMYRRKIVDEKLNLHKEVSDCITNDKASCWTIVKQKIKP